MRTACFHIFPVYFLPFLVYFTFESLIFWQEDKYEGRLNRSHNLKGINIIIRKERGKKEKQAKIGLEKDKTTIARKGL